MKVAVTKPAVTSAEKLPANTSGGEEGSENLERQCEELAATLAIFQEDVEVCLAPAGSPFAASKALRDSFEAGVEETAALLQDQLALGTEEASPGDPILHIRVRLQIRDLGLVFLMIELPRLYPSASAARVTLVLDAAQTSKPTLPKAAMKMITDALEADANDAAKCGGECVVQLVQRAKDLCLDMFELDAAAEEKERSAMRSALAEAQAAAAKAKAEAPATIHTTAKAKPATTRPIEQVLGRRCLFMHHIIADGKRRACLEWAVHFGLCGASKIGWPGVVVVEGPEEGCKNYVSALQRLRWKQCVVRGEQQERVRTSKSSLGPC